MTSIKDFATRTKPISGRFEIPSGILDQLEHLLASTTVPAVVVRGLAILPGLLEIDRDLAATHAKKLLDENPLSLFTNFAAYHREGKVTFQATDAEGNTQRQIAMMISFHLIMVEAVVQYVLGRIFPSFTATTLVEALAEWPHLSPTRRPLLSRAAERFAVQDWVSSGFILVTLYEAVLRDLVRAGGYSALKIEPDRVQMDETLNSLLRAPPVRKILGEKHCDFVELVLCNSSVGWNLRNEVAHGTIRDEDLSPTRVFLAWLLLVRLTSFIAASSNNPDTQN